MFNFFKNFEWVLSLLRQLWDWRFSIMGALVTIWSALTSDWMMQFAPFSIVIAGFVGVILVLIVTYFVQKIRREGQLRKQTTTFIDKHPNLNPLSDTYDRERIYIADLAFPTYPWIENRTFINCQIIGPANIYLAGGEITGSKGGSVDFVYIRPDVDPKNCLGLKDCILAGCSFHEITIFVNQHDYQGLEDEGFVDNFNWTTLTPKDTRKAENKPTRKTKK